MSEWQPISTAPKDETKFLGWSEGSGPGVWWWNSHTFHAGDSGHWMIASYEWYEFDEPTHWMPLPPPPAVEVA